MNDLSKLLEIMQSLRDPKSGCPWDIKQNFSTIAPYTIEEAYEVADAIERKNYSDLKEELGDLLLQVVFHAQMASEQGLFNFHDVVDGLANKLLIRHPHVFGDAEAGTENEVKRLWEARKSQERQEKAHTSVLDDIPRNMPALMRAHKMQKRVAQAGFDWSDIQPVIAKVYEELNEVEDEVKANDRTKLKEELGDLLFVTTNLVRHSGFKAEDTLSAANQKFERRFKAIETELEKQGKSLQESSLEELDAIWEQVKIQEKTV